MLCKIRQICANVSMLILPVVTIGIFLTYRIAISVRLDRAVIGRDYGNLPALLSYPLPRTKICSVPLQV